MFENDREPPAPEQENPQLGTSEPAADAASEANENDTVTEASEGSFPASDAPPWTSSAT
jgi:hypothetical protein